MIGWRLAQLPFILFAVYTVTFLLAWQIPGNPLEKDGRRPPQEVMEQMQAQYNLDDPISFYGDYVWKASGLAWVSGNPFDDAQEGAWCKEGDWVCIGRYAGARFKISGGEVRIINDDEVIATILEPDDIKHV